MISATTTVPCLDKIFGVWAIAPAVGLVIAAALILWLAYFSRTASLRSYLTICVGLAVAMTGLLAWREHQESIRSRNLAVLKAFDSEADQLFQESLDLTKDTDYPVYQAKADSFSKRLDTWVAENLGPRASDILRRQDPKNVNIAFESALDKNHESSLVGINQTRENISALIHAGASDKCVAPTRPEHPVLQPEVRK